MSTSLLIKYSTRFFLIVSFFIAIQTQAAKYTVTNNSAAIIPGSLRDALSKDGLNDTIVFASPMTITLSFTDAAFSSSSTRNSLTIDATFGVGWSAGANKVLIQGVGVPLPSKAFVFNGIPNLSIKGITFQGFTDRTIELFNVENFNIQSCFFGTDLSGANPVTNLATAIYVEGTSYGNIGGSKLKDRNVFFTNSNVKNVLQLYQITPSSGKKVFIQGNRFGTTFDGSTAYNAGSTNGILIIDSKHIQIGGLAVGEGNTINGQNSNAIILVGDNNDSIQIQNNNIGNIIPGGLSSSIGNDGISINSAVDLNLIIEKNNIQNTVLSGVSYTVGANISGVKITQNNFDNNYLPIAGDFNAELFINEAYTNFVKGVGNPGETIELYAQDASTPKKYTYKASVTVGTNGNWVYVPVGNQFNIGQKVFVTSTRISGSTSVMSSSAAITATYEFLVDPQLSFISSAAYVTNGADPFKLDFNKLNSKGAITYEIVRESDGAPTSCATISSDGYVTTTCVEQVRIIARQAKKVPYKADSAYYIMNIGKAITKIKLESRGASLSSAPFQLLFKTNYNEPLQYSIVGDDLGVVSIATDGTITPVALGKAYIVATALGNVDYEYAVSNIVEINIYPNRTKPVALNDTLSLSLAEQKTIDIGENDFGTTASVNLSPSMLLDIDAENVGVQNKYFKPGVGIFTIDTVGVLTFTAFEGFIGTEELLYTITDADGLVSEPAVVFINVTSPVNEIALKANEIITPNFDNINDALVIGYTDLSLENDLLVVDAAGNKLYFESNYQNNWYATTQSGDNLDNGVYYFIFREFNSGGLSKRELKGNFTVIR